MCKMKWSTLRTNAGRTATPGRWRLSPEEDIVGDMLDAENEIDDSLPADLWFRHSRKRRRIRH
jgi:hypothetical protein